MKGFFYEIYKFRALLFALVERHLAQRYRGSLLGFLWSFLNPLLLMGIYTVVFHYYMRFTEVPHYTIFLFCGLLPWIWTSSALIEGTTAIVSGGHLITKSMFPAHLLPLVTVITSLVNFLLALPVLFLFLLLSGVGFHLSLLSLPVLILLQGLILAGGSLLLASCNVLYRDVQHLIGNVLSFLFFLCPIVYPASSVPERFRFTLSLNPFAELIMLYHGVLLEGTFPSPSSLCLLGGWAAFSLVAAYAVFAKFREVFAELL